MNVLMEGCLDRISALRRRWGSSSWDQMNFGVVAILDWRSFSRTEDVCLTRLASDEVDGCLQPPLPMVVFIRPAHFDHALPCFARVNVQCAIGQYWKSKSKQ